jgi:hypothetical protein
MKQKIGNFINFVKNITHENKEKFFNTKNSFIEQKIKIEDINIDNNLNIENISNKNKLQIESPQIKLLQKDNSYINKKNSSKKKEKKNLINLNLADASLNLDNSNLNFKKKEENDNNILTEKELLYFLNEERPILNYIIIIIIFILFLIYIGIFYIHILAIINYTHDNDYLLHCFDNYVSYMWTLPVTLSTIRKNILLNKPISEELLNFQTDIQYYIGNLYNLNQQSNFEIFDKIKYFWHQINIPLNNEDIDLDNICIDFELCKEYIMKEDSFSKGGIILGYELIANEINAKINDYNNLKKEYDAENKLIPKEILKKYIFTDDFIKLQEHIDIIYSRIQHRFYYSYFYDYELNSHRLYNKTIFLNVIFFVYEIFVTIIISKIVLFYMKKKEKEVKEAAYLFNSAFYKDNEEI